MRCFPAGVFDPTLFFLSQVKPTQRKQCLRALMSCTAGAMTSAPRDPHPQGDRVESDTPGFGFSFLAVSGKVTYVPNLKGL